MENQDWFKIKDIDDFVDHARSLVFTLFGEENSKGEDELSFHINSLSKEEIEEMNQTISHDECATIIKNIARKKINRKTKQTTYYLSDKILAQIIEELNGRMISNILNTLVNKGVLDTGFDTDLNDFVFWVKENDNEENQKPETD